MEAKTRTITLTARPPVRIVEAEWPVIASGAGDSYEGGDHARHDQALRRGELATYLIRVRQHADGRTIVYAVFSGDRREGQLLEPGADVAAAIRDVGKLCEIPDRVIRECFADLPAEEI